MKLHKPELLKSMVHYGDIYYFYDFSYPSYNNVVKLFRVRTNYPSINISNDKKYMKLVDKNLIHSYKLQYTLKNIMELEIEVGKKIEWKFV